MHGVTRRTILLAILLFIPAISHAQEQADRQPSPEWFGTWHLDVEQSTFIGKTPYVRGTWKVSRTDAGEILMVYDQVGTRGGVTHMEWKGRFDGGDHRLQGPDAVVSYAYTLVDARTLELLVKVDDRPTAKSRVVLGSDGTVIATTENSTARGPVTTRTVYRKR